METVGIGGRCTHTLLTCKSLIWYLKRLQKHGSVDIIYLTTQDQELIARFSASRRPHPLLSRFKA